MCVVVMLNVTQSGDRGWVQWCIAVPGLVLNTAWSRSTAGCSSVHAAAISILDLSYNVLQWTVMTTTFLRVSKLKYFLWVFIKYFPCVNTGNVLLELNIYMLNLFV